MKKYIIKSLIGCAAALLLLVSQTACSDLFDQNPQGAWVEDDLKSTLLTDVFTMYARVRGGNVSGGIPALAIHSFRSEDAEKGSVPSDGNVHAAMYDDFDYSASNTLIHDYWNSNYEIVHGANRVITAIDSIANERELTEDELINNSEAHFFRGFIYFNLVRAFGEVPLIDFKITDAAQANIKKSTVSEIYALIDADLIEAARHLPDAWPRSYIGRLTWGAAKSLHGKTYMMRNDFPNAKAAFDQVIASRIYDLNTPYEKIFRETGENCSESIFELQCTATTTHPASENLGSLFAQVQGVRNSGIWNLGWGWNTPTQLLADAFEPNDPRKDETLLYFGRNGDDPSTIPANKPWGEKPLALSEVMNKYYNKKAYTDPVLRAQFTRMGFWYNIRLLRYSDVLLMAAEADNEIGGEDNITDALTYLEMIRFRARAGNSSILPAVTTRIKAELREAIRRERRVELGMEFDRFYDLVRWGVAKQVLHAAGKTGYQDRNALLPLPQPAIDNSNGVLIQNSNY